MAARHSRLMTAMYCTWCYLPLAVMKNEPDGEGS
ncbi:MAG: hypothetical protein QOH33_1354, partial [Paraburkholderia sp.]|nr:hypothetical protein [Paraburkholderia sp.]